MFQATGGLLLEVVGIPEDYKILIAIMAVLTVVAGAGWKVFLVVSERIEKAKEKDLAADRERREWTAAESEKNRTHFTEITRDFKEALWQMETRRDQNAEDQGHVLAKMADTLSQVAKNMETHDKVVNEKVVGVLVRIDEQTRPRSNVSKGSSRGAG